MLIVTLLRNPNEGFQMASGNKLVMDHDPYHLVHVELVPSQTKRQTVQNLLRICIQRKSNEAILQPSPQVEKLFKFCIE